MLCGEMANAADLKSASIKENPGSSPGRAIMKPSEMLMAGAERIAVEDAGGSGSRDEARAVRQGEDQVKKTCAVVLVVLLFGCQDPASSRVSAGSNICVYEDKARGVVCYHHCVMTSQSGISCVNADARSIEAPK